jgi:hypothetical protein
MMLYHGSNLEIDTIDLGKCRSYRDFGKGFYTSPVLEQAWKMAKRTVRINKEGSPCVTAFSFDDDLLSDAALSVRQFTFPDNEWARFVINNRNRKYREVQRPDCNTDNKYDIVTGPVANDDIAALIDVFIAGLISDDALARELTFRNLSTQFSFHTEKSIAGLRKTEAYHG